jgi:hypothetical protein
VRHGAGGTSGIEVSVDVVEIEAGGHHQHLEVVQQLADLLGGALATLVLGRHPHLGGLLHDLLADRVDAGIERRHGPGPRRSVGGLVLQLGEQGLEALHARLSSGDGRA